MLKKKTFYSPKSYKIKKSLTTKQKIIIIVAAVLAALAIAAVIIYFCVGANGGSGSSSGSGGGVFGGLFDLGSDQNPSVVEGFYISSEPSKKRYYVGDNANYSGLEIFLRGKNLSDYYISYDDDPDAFTITGFDSSATVEKQTITVEYKGFTDTFTVEIIEVPTLKPMLQSIYLDPLPKTTYKLGESLDLTDAYIVCVYSDGSTETVKLRMKYISGFGNISTVGEHQLKVVYFDDNGGYAETFFTVTMTE